MESDNKIEWRAPAIVTQRRQDEAKSLIRLLMLRAWPAVTIAVVSVLSIAVIIAYFYGPLLYGEDSDKLIKGLFFMGLFFPTTFILLMTLPLLPSLFSRKGDVYVMNEKGLYRRSHEQASITSWRRFKDYRFTDHHDLVGIRILEFTTKPIKYIRDDREYWIQFYFDPNDIKEETLKAFIERHITV